MHKITPILLIFTIFISSVLAEDGEQKERIRLSPFEVEASTVRDTLISPELEPVGLETSLTEVTQTQIQKQGSQTITDAMNYVPGAWIETRGRKVKQFFSIRGQKYPYPDYAIDGAWLREFHEIPYFFSPHEIEKIEIMRSSAALMSGLGGLVGVINIVPRKYRDPETTAEMEYGSFNTYRFRMSHGATSRDFSYAFGLGANHTRGPEGKHAVENMTNFRSMLGWTPSERLSLEANFFHIYGKRELLRAEPPATESLQTTNEEFDPFNTSLATVSALYMPTDRVSVRSVWYYNRRDHDFKNPDPTGHKATREYDSEFGWNLTGATALTRNNTLRVGTLYNRWVAPNGKRFFVGRRCDLETISAVVSDEQRLGRITLDGGLRWAKTYINEYGAFNIDGSSKKFKDVDSVVDQWEPAVLTANISASLSVVPGVSLHGNLAMGQIEPRAGTLDVDLEEPDNETRIKLDFGTRFRMKSIGRLSVTGFVVRRKDAILLSGKTHTAEDGRIMELYVNKDQNQIGLEFDLLSAPIRDTVQAFGNLVLMNTQTENEGKMVDEPDMPKVVAAGGLYFARSRLDVNLFAKYVSRYESTRFVQTQQGQPAEPQELGDFVTFNANATCHLDSGRQTALYLRIENLTDNRFSTVVGYPDVGRRFTIGIRRTSR